VEAKATLEWAKCGVELNAEATVDLDVSLVVYPWHTEDDLALWLADALKDCSVCVLWVLGQDWGKGLEDFAYCLVEFCFAWVAAQHLVVDWCELTFHVVWSPLPKFSLRALVSRLNEPRWHVVRALPCSSLQLLIPAK
jgi:hypothetical protein